MPFGEFGFPDVLSKLGSAQSADNLYGSVAALPAPPEFEVYVREGAELATSAGTEKARSEFIIAPVLLHLRSRLGNSFGLFSGVDFAADRSRELHGCCDFILTRLPKSYTVQSPVVAIAEAKNDNLHSGLGQCIAAMVAARDFNAAATPPETSPV